MIAYSLKQSEKEGEESVSNLAEPLVEVRPPSNAHIVRLPLYDEVMEVYAYELLYGEINKTKDTESSEASQVMLNAFLDIGLDVISEDRLSVITITEDFVLGRLPLPFPPAGMVLELPESMSRPGI